MVIKDNTRSFQTLSNIPILESFNHESSLYTVPVFQKSNEFFIELANLMRKCENSNLNLLESVHNVCSINNIDSKDACLLINEEELYLSESMPMLIQEFQNLGISVKINQSEEVRAFLEALDNAHNDPNYEVKYTHGGYQDDRDSIEHSTKSFADDITKVFADLRQLDDKADKDTRDMVNWAKQNAAEGYHKEADKAALNRNLLNGRSKTGYTGNFLGTSGTGMYWNKKKIDKVHDLMNKEAEKQGGISGKLQKSVGTAMINMIKSDINNTEDKMRDIAHHIEREEVPRNVLARLIAKLRGVYHKIMFRAKTGYYTKKGMHGFMGDIEKMDSEDLQKTSGLKYTAKAYWSMGKHGLPALLKNLAGKILWLIDKLLQKLQNKANAAGDKLHSWINKGSNNPVSA